jgi:putative mycofactocin binding protein MftB
MNTGAHYQLAEKIAIRRERFGALVYNYRTRRLCFIHSHLATDFVNGLDGARPLDEALAGFLDRHGLGEADGQTLLRTIERLEAMGVVRQVLQ